MSVPRFPLFVFVAYFHENSVPRTYKSPEITVQFEQITHRTEYHVQGDSRNMHA